MPAKVHPCPCGFMTDTYPKMRYHRRSCTIWQTRPDPKELTRSRRATHRRPKPDAGRCEHCKGRMGRHREGCKDSLEERTRRELLGRHGIDEKWWGEFLKVLKERYEA